MHSKTTTSALAAGVNLDAIWRRFCTHEVAYLPDPMAVTWERDLFCFYCGATVDPVLYDDDPAEPSLRRLRREEGIVS